MDPRPGSWKLKDAYRFLISNDIGLCIGREVDTSNLYNLVAQGTNKKQEVNMVDIGFLFFCDNWR